jgi:hypothetical protein
MNHRPLPLTVQTDPSTLCFSRKDNELEPTQHQPHSTQTKKTHSTSNTNPLKPPRTRKTPHHHQFVPTERFSLVQTNQHRAPSGTVATIDFRLVATNLSTSGKPIYKQYLDQSGRLTDPIPSPPSSKASYLAPNRGARNRCTHAQTHDRSPV